MKIAVFVDLYDLWAEEMVAAFNQASNVARKLTLGDQAEKVIGILSNPEKIGLLSKKWVISLNLLCAEFAILKADREGAQRLGLDVLQSLAVDATPWANALRARAQLCLGVVGRTFPEKIHEALGFLTSAIDSKMLVEGDEIYARGNQALLHLNLNNQDVAALEVFNTSLRTLEEIDGSRFGILSTEMGNFCFSRNDFVGAQRFYEQAREAFVAVKDFVRELGVLRLIGRVSFNQGNYAEAVSVFRLGNKRADDLFWVHESINFLVQLCRAFYMMGDLPGFSEHCERLAVLCERNRMRRQMDSIFEHATHTYLEQGRIKKALQLIENQMDSANEATEDHREMILLLSTLLKIAVCQRIEKWQLADRERETVRQMMDGVDQKHAAFPVLKQVLLYYDMEFIRHAKGLPQAIEFFQNVFLKEAKSEELITEGYFRFFHFLIRDNRSDLFDDVAKRCSQNLAKTAYQNQVVYFANLCAWHLSLGDLLQAEAVLGQGEKLMGLITSFVSRAQFLTQHGRLLLAQGKKTEALGKFQAAESEFQHFTRTWDEADRQRFFDLSPDVKEHREILNLIGVNELAAKP